MPAIDWTTPGVVVVLAAFGAILMLLGLLFYFLPPPRLKGLALLAGISGGLTVGAALTLYSMPSAPADPGKAAEFPPSEPVPPAVPVPARTSQEALDRFRQATPAQRLALLARLPDSAAAWYTVQRGDVDSLVERGSLESADNADVVVKVRARKPDSPAGTIRKVHVDDGAMVKKGDLLIELDDSALQDQLQAQKIAVETAKGDATQAETDREIDNEQAALDIKVAQNQLALAERDLRAYKGSDADEKRQRELQLEQARLTLKAREAQAIRKKSLAEAKVRTARAALTLETARLRDLESDIANCKMVAPRDGQVVFHVPEQTRFGTLQVIVAPGEPVREKQKLLSIPDLAKMQVHTRIHEALIPLVCLDQTASVRVDAFPTQAFTGKVAWISPVGENQRDVKVFSVTIALTNNLEGLKPGMSAEIRLPMKPRRNVLRVPVRALAHSGGRVVCFVQAGEEIQERPVMTGLGDNDFLEIRHSLLQEGDRVLRDPRNVARQLAGLPAEVGGRPSPAARGSRGKGGYPGDRGRPAP
jgi:HlyD family secretion protein